MSLRSYKERATVIQFNVIAVQEVSGLCELFLYASYFPSSFFQCTKPGAHYPEPPYVLYPRINPFFSVKNYF